jgi:hypothetical protein
MGKHHSQAFREAIAKLIVDDHRIAHDVAVEKGLPDSSISRWVAAYKARGRNSVPKQPLTRERLEKAKDSYMKEMEQIDKENEILRKTMQFFTGKQEP